MSQAHADCPHCRQDGSEAKHIALKEVRIALAGNPNCGKTTAFNEYTGTHQHVGNYPGVTVDKKEGYVSIDGVEVLMVDLPGTYSLTAYSQEEIVTRAVLAPEKAEEKPMAVVDLVDTSALERNLFLTVQIMEMGLPVVLACNMMDEARKAGIQWIRRSWANSSAFPLWRPWRVPAKASRTLCAKPSPLDAGGALR